MCEDNDTFQFDELSQASAYPESIMRFFSPAIGENILEIGSGIGNVTRFLKEQFPDSRLNLLEPNPEFCKQLHEKYPDLSLHPGTTDELPAEFHCDTIINVNVLEHIENDLDELKLYARILAPDKGNLCLFLPARPEIYAPIDTLFGHYRRYTRASLVKKLHDTGFEIKKIRYSNLIGYFGWAAEFRWRKKTTFSPWKIALFDTVIWPVMSRIERVIPPPIGQSLIAIARVRD